jgi:HAD superfamily hydrolase (TIGR01509 family)
LQADAILFDLFDTLILLQSQDVYYPQSLRRLHQFLVKNGINTSSEDFERVYFEVRDKFYSESRLSLEEPHFNVRVSQTLKTLGYDFDASDPIVVGATMAFAEEFMRHVRLDKDTVEVLHRLHGKHKLGLVSNFAIPECCWELLDKFCLRKFFDTVVISGEVNRRKPSHEIFEKALKSLGVKASRTVFVGDMLDLDVIGPKSLGMKTVLIRRRPLEENARAKPDRVITHLTELLVVLDDC